MRSDPDIDEGAILPLVTPRSRVLDWVVVVLGHVLHQQMQVLARPYIGEVHGLELFPGVAIPGHGGIVDLQEAQRLEVVHPHRTRVVGKHLPEAGLTGAELLLDGPSPADVAESYYRPLDGALNHDRVGPVLDRDRSAFLSPENLVVQTGGPTGPRGDGDRAVRGLVDLAILVVVMDQGVQVLAPELPRFEA